VNTPQPDPDPLDGDGHGTHVASTAAGMAVEGSISHGVAPGVLIYALKVFGEPAGGSELAINAIEWSVDPNQDNDLSDHVDVINMSLGEDYGVADPLDPANIAVEYASDVGIVVVASAGNAGDVSYITGDPAGSKSAISVAASTTGFLTGPTISIEPSAEITRTQFIYNVPAFDENTGLFTETLSAPLAYTGNLFADDLLCEILPEAAGTTPLAGMVALIQRGTCASPIK
jgi:subtilisin family serine protease